MCAKFATVLSAVPLILWASASGPIPRSSGGPAPTDRTCAQATCHVGTANPAGGSVQVTFSDGNTYTPGIKKRVTVRVMDTASTARRAGFQASARLASNPNTGQAGRFENVDASTFVQCEENSGGDRGSGNCRLLEFIQHETPKMIGSDFVFEWTPPSSNVGDVNFYVAGNAANGNTTESGDRIFTTTATLTFAQGGGGGPRPTISSGGVVNAGSGAPNIASNTWISIFGSEMAAALRQIDGSDVRDNRLPTSLADVSVEVNGRAAFLQFVSPAQVNALVPDDGDTGNVRVEVIRAGQRSTAAMVLKQALSPGFLPFRDSAGRLYIAARHADFSVVGKTGLFPNAAANFTTPARPGEVILLFAVGFGPTTPAVEAGVIPSAIARTTNEARVFFGDAPATVSYAGVSPGSAGLYQLNVEVPATAPNGDVPVRAEIGGLRTQENIFITVQR